MKLQVLFIIILSCLISSSWCILTSNDGAPTLCETDYCDCSNSVSTVTCSCSTLSPPNGEIVLRADGPASLPRSLTFLKVFHCPRVIVTSRAFALLRSLRQIELTDIDILDIHESGLIWEPHRHGNHTIQTINGGPIVGQYEEVYGGENTLPVVTISLNNIKYIQELPRFTFGGHLEFITFDNVNIDKIYSYAFTNLRGKIEKIEFKNTNINYIDAQAFKRIYLDNFIIIDSNINKFESRSFYECRVKKELKFQNVTIDEIASSAIGITGPLKTNINYCNISHISGESFKILTRGTVTISDNIFNIMDTGALYGFKPLEGEDLVKDLFLYNPAEHESPHTVPSIEDGYKPEKPRKPDIKIKRDFILQNNSIVTYNQGALKISNRYKVTFQKVILPETNCDCKLVENLIVDLLGIPDSPDKEFASPPAHDTAQLQRTTWCRVKNIYVTLPQFKDEHCAIIRKSSMLYVALGVAAFVLIIVLILSLGIIFWYRSSKRKKSDPQHKKIMMVVPDTRTYRETELQIIVERAEPIPPSPETHQLLTPNSDNDRHVTFEN